MWVIFDAVIVGILIWAICFQMIIPTYLNRQMWPMFRKEAKLKDELTALNTEEVTNDLKEKVAARKKVVRSKKPQ